MKSIFSKILSFGFYKKKVFYLAKEDRKLYKNHLIQIKFNHTLIRYLYYFLYNIILNKTHMIPSILNERINNSHFHRIGEIFQISYFLKLKKFIIEFLYDTEFIDLFYSLKNYKFNIKNIGEHNFAITPEFNLNGDHSYRDIILMRFESISIKNGFGSIKEKIPLGTKDIDGCLVEDENLTNNGDSLLY